MIMILLAAAAGPVFIFSVVSRLDAIRDWLAEDPSQAHERFRYVAAALSLGLAVPILWFSIDSWVLAGRIRKAGRFPPPGMRVGRDTVIAHGPQAQRRATFLQWLVIVLVLSTAGFIAALWRLVGIFER